MHQVRLLAEAFSAGLSMRLPSRQDSVPRVTYGYPRIPVRSEKTGGAIVKLQDLQERFSESNETPNILYLVSSALPPYITVTETLRPRCCQLVWNQNGVAYPAWHGEGWEETNKPMKRFLHSADYVFYQSEFAKRAADCFLGERKGPSEVLYNAVDTRRFIPPATALSGFRILLAGSHNQFYRVETAINTLAIVRRTIPEARLVLAGRYQWTDQEQLALSQVREVALKAGVDRAVEAVGPYTQDEVVDLLGSTHVLLHTQYNDCCPRLVLEAMSCGLPVVYSASGGTPELVGPDAGIGIPAPEDWEVAHPPQPEELADALCQVARRRAELSLLARRRAVERFDVHIWFDRHLKVFQQAAAKTGR